MWSLITFHKFKLLHTPHTLSAFTAQFLQYKPHQDVKDMHNTRKCFCSTHLSVVKSGKSALLSMDEEQHYVEKVNLTNVAFIRYSSFLIQSYFIHCTYWPNVCKYVRASFWVSLQSHIYFQVDFYFHSAYCCIEMLYTKLLMYFFKVCYMPACFCNQLSFITIYSYYVCIVSFVFLCMIE